MSIRWSCSASDAVQLRGQRGQAALLGSTACAAAAALRPLPPARKRIWASESWISLLRRSLPTLPPPMSIGVAAPGVRGRHHGREVGCLEQEEARAGRARAARRDVRDHGHRGAQLGLRDLAHRRQQAARRVELEHHGVVVRARRGMDLVDDPVGRDGIDVGVEDDDSHVRAGGRGARREREPGDEGDGQEAQCAHRRPQPIPGGSRWRDAGAAGEAGVVKLALTRCLPLVVAVLLAFAPAAQAAATRYGELTVRAPGTAGTHILPPQRAPFAFDLVGARWNARPGTAVAVRTRAAAGVWSAWTTLDADPGGSVAHADPAWLAGSRVLQVRVRGPLSRVRIAFVAADRSPLRPLRGLAAAPGEPAIISRAGWGADEALKRAPPRYAEATHMVFIHHTDTPNGYAPPTCPRSSARSTPTTCARTAGTTSATTSSSTRTGASSRAAQAVSTARSSARRRWASTPAASASP